MFVLGTAGHIDHGKSALVQALTGIDPDRLLEEKERGMTLDLGFAWLKLPGGGEVGIVDVPGHERLIKNMVAGVGGIDLALLIVDASEGVMPQTREHLAILDLLGVDRGLAVITKKDLVDSEWLKLVTADVEKLLEPTSLRRAQVLAVSAVTGEGLSELVSAIDRLVSSAPPKRDIGRPRLPIDRVFTMSGSGTVVTGTLVDGSLSVGQEIEITPRGLKSRIRGLQTHKTRLDTVLPGNRVGVNLVGVAKSQLERGDVLTSPGWLQATTRLIVELRLISYLPRSLRHGATVSFHTGTAQAMAEVRLLERTELRPGEAGLAHLSLSKPVALVRGDRFIIRSPEETLGGGVVVESRARRYRRFPAGGIESLRRKAQGSAEEVVLAVFGAGEPLEPAALRSRSELPASELEPALESLVEQGKLVAVGEGGSRLFFTAAGWERLVAAVVGTLERYHREFPARLGIPRAELASRLKMSVRHQVVLARLLGEGVIVEDTGAVRLPGHQVRLSPAQQAKVTAFLNELEANPYNPSRELIPDPELLNLLVARRQVVKVAADVVFSSAAYDEMVALVSDYLKSHGKVTVAEVRDMFHTSRKYALAFLEHLDGAKITRRVADERVLY
ncbi:MAG: selenocysteine-specific translation elongation factor [Dehalococcoidales bacterium]|nr:selenocysteine-specific translation elongation factor [Dehalococcoidales bacterium]